MPEYHVGCGTFWRKTMADDYIRREDALKGQKTGTFANSICLEAKRCVPVDYIESIEPADVLPYSIDPDGTLTVTVPKGTTVNRVLVQEDGTQWGGLFYAD